MNGFAAWLDDLDKKTFLAIRNAFQGEFMENNAGLLGDIYAWVPMIVFLVIVVYVTKPGAGVFSLFFGLAAFVLSFQASMLLAKWLYQPSPVKLEYFLNHVELPAFGRALALSLPDWEIASLVAIFHFTKLRLKLFGGPNILLGWLGIVVFCLLRIYAGYTFPLGAIVAVLVGVLIAWLMFQLARSVELLSPGLGGQADEAEAKDQEMP